MADRVADAIESEAKRPAIAEPLFFRFLAAFLVLFALLNFARELLRPGFSAAYILFYFPFIRWGADICLFLWALLLALSAFGPVKNRAFALFLGTSLLGLAGLAFLNALQFYRLIDKGSLSTSWPVPLSVPLAIYLLLHVFFCLRIRYRIAQHIALDPSLRVAPPRKASIRAALFSALLVLFLSIIFYVHSLGLTDYRRPADAILVLGARVYADGRPSEALWERVQTGVSLYHQGYAKRLIMSGGIGEGGHSEPRVMRNLAVQAGVPGEFILEDELGINTEATVRNLEGIEKLHGMRTVLAVSHYHHLPRIQLLCARRGLRCYTVPADEGSDLLRKTPYYVLRETVALVWAYLKG